MTAILSRKPVRLLVLYFGGYQALHLGLNISYFAGAVSFPPPPSTGAWEPQAQDLFNAMAAVDIAVAALSLAFAVAFLGRRPWSLWIGLMAIAATVPPAVMFTYTIWANGSSLPALLLIDLAYLPILLLLVLLCRAVHRGEGARAGF